MRRIQCLLESKPNYVGCTMQLIGCARSPVPKFTNQVSGTSRCTACCREALDLIHVCFDPCVWHDSAAMVAQVVLMLKPPACVAKLLTCCSHSSMYRPLPHKCMHKANKHAGSETHVKPPQRPRTLCTHKHAHKVNRAPSDTHARTYTQHVFPYRWCVMIFRGSFFR